MTASTVLVALAACLTPPTAPALAPTVAPAAGVVRAQESLADRFQAARRAYRVACVEWRKARRGAADEDASAPHPAAAALPGMRALADAGLADAWLWIAEECENLPRTREEVAELKRAAFARLAQGFLDDPLMEDVAKQLARQEDWLPAEELRAHLTRILERAGEAGARAEAAYALGRLLEAEGTIASLAGARAHYAQLIEDFPESKPARRARSRLEALRFAPGNPAPDFATEDVDGKPFKLSDYRGKVVVLDFWGFW